MAELLDKLPPRTALVQVARDFHARGWMSGTAGNLSVRSAPDRFWITASAQPKGRLQEHDFLEVAVSDGEVLKRLGTDLKPSAETAIHGVIYALFPQVHACLHVHSVDACIASERAGPVDRTIPLPRIEMLKGLGIWDPQPDARLEMFENLPAVADIAAAIRERFAGTPPMVPALMIRGHGATVWGESLQQAYDRVECLEFLFAFMARCGPQGAPTGGRPL